MPRALLVRWPRKRLGILPDASKETLTLLDDLVDHMSLPDLSVVDAEPAHASDIASFHARDYLRVLQRAEKELDDDEAEEYGLQHDCPPFPGLWNYCCLVAGGALLAADRLLDDDQVDCAVFWPGGRHHAMMDSAHGFCYINDAVLAIQRLRQAHDRVVYLDLDAHHGDGVAEAFITDPDVLCISVHRFGPGFFPGTGDITDAGVGDAKATTLNIPVLQRCSDKHWLALLAPCLDALESTWKPDAVVLQCGVDALHTDPLCGLGLSSTAFLTIVRRVCKLACPLLVLGGGGYNPAISSRVWASVTAVLAGADVAQLDVPDDCKYFERHGPDFRFSIPGIADEADDDAADGDAAYYASLGKELAQRLAQLGKSDTPTAVLDDIVDAA